MRLFIHSISIPNLTNTYGVFTNLNHALKQRFVKKRTSAKKNDKEIPLTVDFLSGKPATEIFNQVYIDSLKTALTETWKNTK